MRKILLFSLLSLIFFSAAPQSKKRGRVKRKYRTVEQVNQRLPQAIFRGVVRDEDRKPVPGASVEIEGLRRRVHTNESGEFSLTNLPSGKLRIKVSCLGYLTRTIDYVMQPGFNDHYIALDRDRIRLDPLPVTSFHRYMQIPDVLTAIDGVSGAFLTKMQSTGFREVVTFFPGLQPEEGAGGINGFSLRGSTGGSGFPGTAPDVAVTRDGVPLDLGIGFSAELFDMERTEVLKGPQNVYFGRDASGGAVRFFSKKPQPQPGGYIEAGAGNYENRRVRAAVNVPLWEDLLFVRAAGYYRHRKGFLENSEGGTLNGRNSAAGRFSVRFLPAYNHRIDLVMNYQKKEAPGNAFLNPWYGGKAGASGLFDTPVSLGSGDALFSESEYMGATLTYRYFRNEHNYWTSISSYRKGSAAARWDADGTTLSALAMENRLGSEQFFQEIRYNFSRQSRTHGSLGLRYRRVSRDLFHDIASNDRFLLEILSDSGNFVMPRESRFPVQPRPLDPWPAVHFPVSGPHQEVISGKSMFRSLQSYLHFNRQLFRRIFFYGGVRAFLDRLHYAQEALFEEGEASALGQLTGTAPNIFYLPSESQEITKNSFSFTGVAGVSYRWNENIRYFVNVSRGRRPQVLQFSWDSRPQVVDAEKVNSLEAGWKIVLPSRIFWDATAFFRQHSDVQTVQWRGDPGNGLLAANGKANVYGAETGLRVALLEGLKFFGNYAWFRSAFDSTGVNGDPFIYAGNSFARAPEHCFSVGINAETEVHPGFRIFVSPWYSWKSRFWFTEANIEGLAQPAFGLVNARLGVEVDDPRLILNIGGTNLLEEKYFMGAGHWGGLLGLPTFTPGSPRMLEATLTWKF